MKNYLKALVVLFVINNIILLMILAYISVVNKNILEKYYLLESKVDNINKVLSSWELTE